MQRVVSVIFRKGGKAYYFDPEGLELATGDSVVVKTARGIEFAEVVAPAQDVPDEIVPGQLKKVIRKANEGDLATVAENRSKEEEAFKVCQEKIAKHGLDMKLVDAEVIFDGSKTLFFFTSEERVDFRALVRELASIFKTRIEMRQIGVRDEAKIIGGLGPCGRRLCCTLFAGEFEPVSIRMAKEQNLPLNPMKISGICGRLMCCLRYEYETYREFNRRAPKKGTAVSTSFGDGKIVEYDVPRELCTIQLETGLTKQVPLCEVCGQGGRAKAAAASQTSGAGAEQEKPQSGQEAEEQGEPTPAGGPPTDGAQRETRPSGRRRGRRGRRSRQKNPEAPPDG